MSLISWLICRVEWCRLSFLIGRIVIIYIYWVIISAITTTLSCFSIYTIASTKDWIWVLLWYSIISCSCFITMDYSSMIVTIDVVCILILSKSFLNILFNYFLEYWLWHSTIIHSASLSSITTCYKSTYRIQEIIHLFTKGVKMT